MGGRSSPPLKPLNPSPLNPLNLPHPPNPENMFKSDVHEDASVVSEKKKKAELFNIDLNSAENRAILDKKHNAKFTEVGWERAFCVI